MIILYMCSFSTWHDLLKYLRTNFTNLPQISINAWIFEPNNPLPFKTNHNIKNKCANTECLVQQYISFKT